MFDTSLLIDGLFTLAACTSAGFLVYGGWLCLYNCGEQGMQSHGADAQTETQVTQSPGASR